MQTRRNKQRGATMVSVMLLTVSLLTVGVLVMRQSHQEVAEAGALVARERATTVAQGAIDLAAARYRDALKSEGDPITYVNTQLTGFNVQANPTVCDDPFKDCIPGQGDATVPLTGQKNSLITGRTDCSGRPCMRQGAVVRLPDANLNDIDWAQVPMADLLDNADPEARVTVWIRNNTVDAVGNSISSQGDWLQDGDGRVVLTAMATLRNTTVAIEQELVISPGTDASPWQMQTPDLAYGGGHNNDNASVDVCRDNYAEGQ